MGVKLVRLDEPLSTEGLAVLGLVKEDSRSWGSPDIFDLECAEAMAKVSRRYALQPDDAFNAFGLLRRLPHRRYSTSGLVEAALAVALDAVLTVHDACYVVLAALLEVPLVTADAKLMERLAGTTHKAIHLSDLEL